MSNQANMPEKMDLRSMDVSEQNRTTLKNLFPGVFVETRNEKGELVERIDFEKLKAELGTFSDVFEKRRERYGMDWPGKKTGRTGQGIIAHCIKESACCSRCLTCEIEFV
jgi:adenine-specific DNA-methyltransferase